MKFIHSNEMYKLVYRKNASGICACYTDGAYILGTSSILVQFFAVTDPDMNSIWERLRDLGMNYAKYKHMGHVHTFPTLYNVNTTCAPMDIRAWCDSLLDPFTVLHVLQQPPSRKRKRQV